LQDIQLLAHRSAPREGGLFFEKSKERLVRDPKERR